MRGNSLHVAAEYNPLTHRPLGVLNFEDKLSALLDEIVDAVELGDTVINLCQNRLLYLILLQLNRLSDNTHQSAGGRVTSYTFRG